MSMAPAKPYRVLVVDDNPGVLKLLEEVFTLMGWAVDTADHGDGVLEKACATGPDLILLDLMMPGLDGFTVLTRIRSDARLSEIPVLLMSGEPASVQASIGTKLGASAYIEKPFKPEALRKLVEGLFAGERTR